MTKRDFFKCFYPAWHTAFTYENIASSWSKTGPLPFNPALVVDKLIPPNQKEPMSRERSKGLSSSPSAYLDSPFGMRRLRTFINKIVDRKTKKVIKRLSDDLQKGKAEATLEKVGKQQAMEALRHEKKKRKRGKKLVEQFRAEEGSGSILFSPGKVKAALELQDRREQDKEQRAQERALAKFRKEQEAQKKRGDRAIAQAARKAAKELQTAQKEADRAARKAKKQAELDLKAQSKRPRGRSKKQQASVEPVVIEHPTRALEGAKQLRSRSGRTIRVPVHLLD
jgi:hypothetical protein